MEVEDMGVVVNLRRSKTIYKIELYLTKIIPVILAGLYFSNTVLSYFNIDLVLFSTLGGVSIIIAIYLYITSYSLKLCNYHRVPIHYIVLNDAICWFDYVYGISLSDREYLILHIIVAGIMMFIALYLKLIKMNNFIVRTVSRLLREIADKIDAGNCELSEEQAMDIMAVLSHEVLSKDEACKYLNISRSRFDDLIRAKKLPKGRKRRGFKELVFYKDELEVALRKLKNENSDNKIPLRSTC